MLLAAKLDFWAPRSLDNCLWFVLPRQFFVLSRTGQSLIDPTRPVQPLTENETFSFELLRKTLPIEERTLVEQWLRDRQIVFAKQKFAQEKKEAKEAEQKLIAEALRIKEVARKQKIRQRKMAEQSKREEEEAQR